MNFVFARFDARGSFAMTHRVPLWLTRVSPSWSMRYVGLALVKLEKATSAASIALEHAFFVERAGPMKTSLWDSIRSFPDTRLQPDSRYESPSNVIVNATPSGNARRLPLISTSLHFVCSRTLASEPCADAAA